MCVARPLPPTRPPSDEHFTIARLAAVIAFYGINGLRLTLTNDEAYEVAMAVASGRLDDVGSIAQQLARSSHSPG